jgi:hypothetical protein
MDDIIRKVDYFKAQVQDKAQLDFVPENGPAFRKAAKALGAT